MARIDDLVLTALRSLEAKPDDNAAQSQKKRYSERVSEVVALAIAEELRKRGLREARPAAPGELGGSGAERRMAGGLGAKKVDITWATEASGLLLAISIKSINFKDSKTGNYQKNLVNRRGDMLMEAVTLHRRFPYAVLGALFFFDKGAVTDGTTRRRSTFENAHARLKLFTGRNDPAGRDEQFEKFYLVALEADPQFAKVQAFEVGKPNEEVSLNSIITELLTMVTERSPDFYEMDGEDIRSLS
ncbi:hypothetical protein ML401_37990 (plasmid) [Bradyrhizobium sp. 62B]|uniref:hypothetical protein n=1 Tax=Bradyrhizobium sp. 62B TaxID=2898442 RepID=UPI002557CCF1|nr:hypothetical protein ML401_37990 [Bradyrhizobium sp. 62B]